MKMRFEESPTIRTVVARAIWMSVTVMWVIAAYVVGNRASAARSSWVHRNEGWEMVSVEPTQVLGPMKSIEGQRSAPYVIVEFGDYQCPYCRRAEGERSRLMDLAGRQVSTVFRQYPLESLHPHAMSAAIASEAASDQGKFGAMHRLLMTTELAPANLEQDARDAGLDLAWASKSASDEARRGILADFAAAKLLGVQGTPSFFLVSPGGAVRRFDSISHLSRFVSRALNIAFTDSVSNNAADGACGPNSNKCAP